MFKTKYVMKPLWEWKVIQQEKKMTKAIELRKYAEDR